MSVVDFYDRHPISEAQVVAAVARRRGGDLSGPIAPDELFDFDQDHYGGLGAVAALARLADMTPDARVLDVCSGLGGPARFLAWRLGCRVVGVELNHGRAAGAWRLTKRVGLAHRVAIVEADAVALPLAASGFDAAISQEAFLHVHDKAGVLRECRRVLRAGGRLAFTDWIAHPRLDDGERRRLQKWMTATTLQSLHGYRELLGRAGFAAVTAEDLTDAWRPILRARLETYRALRRDTVARLGETWYREFQRVYRFFVQLIEAGKLGGGRFSGTA